MKTNTPLAEMLRRYMQECGVSLEQLASESGVPKQTIHHWLEGSVHKPHTWQSLMKVARALDLKKAQANVLLHAANQLSVDTLLRTVTRELDKALLESWAITAPHNLPSPVTTFIGRETEVARLTNLLYTERLVTLTGSGGSGKTRLALHAATELLDTFEDGVFFIGLAPITDRLLVMSAIARPLGVKEAAGEPLIERVKAHLHSKHLLLLLDNFEQVVAAAPLVTELLQAASNLSVLVTSRVRLHLYGEHEFPTLPFSIPALHATFTKLAQNEAVQLFTRRAQAAQLGFVLTSHNAPAVAEICRRLDGLPLAIELAAARSKQFSPQALLAIFPSGLDIAQDGPQDVPPRHQTLRHAIAWSYDLLRPGEQKLFRRLAVFVGGCTLEAAAAVCSEPTDPRVDIAEELAALGDIHLLWQGKGASSEPRFLMLETIREYALEQLLVSGEAEEVQWRHTHYYLELAEAAEPELYGPQQGVWRARLESEQSNFRAAFHWLDQHAEVELGLRLTSKLTEFWDKHGYLSEGRAWLEQLLAKRASLTGSSVSASVLAEALLDAGILADDQADYVRAQAYYIESLALYRELGNHLGAAEALAGLGGAAINQGDLAGAQAHWEKSLDLHRAIDNRRGIAGLLNNLGTLALVQGEYDRASALLEESLVLYQEQGSQTGIAMTYFNLGDVALRVGNYRHAHQLYKESLALFYELRNRRGIAHALEGLGTVHEAAGRHAETLRQAAVLWAAAAVLRMEIGAPLPGNDRGELEQMQARVRAQVDEAAWRAAWAEGEGLTLEQAIAYTLELENPFEQQS
jgi:predicted ATPase